MNPRIWDKETAITLMDGKVYNNAKELAQEKGFEFVKVATVFIEDIEPGIVGEISTMAAIRSSFRIPDTMTNDEAIQEYVQIRDVRANPPPEQKSMTQVDMQYLLQQITELELTILEAGNV